MFGSGNHNSLLIILNLCKIYFERELIKGKDSGFTIFLTMQRFAQTKYFKAF
jgi:hypothetical protein